MRPAAARTAGGRGQHRGPVLPDLGAYLHRLAGRDRLAELAIDDDQDTVVRRAFDLSYRALTVPARRMFRLSSVTPGSDLTEPTAAALAGEPAGAALAELADAHLVDEYRPGATARTTCSTSTPRNATRPRTPPRTGRPPNTGCSSTA